MDTGGRATHEDYGGRLIPTIDTTTKKVVECSPGDASCARDVQGHGSHCSGTIGGKVHGVAKGATLHACKVMNSRRDGSTLRNLLAIDWVAKNAIKPALMSMSLGADGKSNAMNFSITRAYNNGILSVVAAGNIGNGAVRDGQACSQTPAHVEVAYVVSATTSSDSRASYSNYGPCANIFAPGDRIQSTCHTRDNHYCQMSGTSMACPHVSGAVALLLGKYPLLTPDQIMETMTKYATPDVVRSAGTGTPNKFLYVTDYETDYPPPTTPTTSTTTRKPEDFGRRRTPKGPGRRRSPRRRKGGPTRRRSGKSRRRKGGSSRRRSPRRRS